MAASAIEWTEVTWNPVTGCDQISVGCDNCYALTLAKRLKAMGQPKYQHDGDARTSGPGFGLTVHPQELTLPFRWKRARRVFVNSMSDLFHQDVPDDFIAAVFATMSLADQHQYQVLTKRPQRMAKLLASPTFVRTLSDQRGAAAGNFIWPLPNVWLGTSIESDTFAWRVNHLRATPAAVRFLSLEPLLTALPTLDMHDLDWVIVGGESGHRARPIQLGWIRDLRKQARADGVAFFVKQLGTRWAATHGYGQTHGVEWDQWPADLRVREYPAEAALSLV